MCNDHLGVSSETRLDTASLPFPEHDVPFTVAAAYPLAIGREAHLAGVPRNRMSRKSLVPCLPEIIRAVHEDLVVQ